MKISETKYRQKKLFSRSLFKILWLIYCYIFLPDEKQWEKINRSLLLLPRPYRRQDSSLRHLPNC